MRGPCRSSCSGLSTNLTAGCHAQIGEVFSTAVQTANAPQSTSLPRDVTARQRFAEHEPIHPYTSRRHARYNFRHAEKGHSARIFRGRTCKSELRRPEARDHQQEALAFPAFIWTRITWDSFSQQSGGLLIAISLALFVRCAPNRNSTGYHLCASNGNEGPLTVPSVLVTLAVARGASVPAMLGKGRIHFVRLAMKPRECSVIRQEPPPAG